MPLTTLRAFEHGTVRIGSSLNGHDPSAALTQSQFDALARFNDSHGQRYFRLGHRRLTFCSFVGYLQVGKLAIEILPKLDRGTPRPEAHAHWQSFLLEMLRVALGLPLQTPTDALRDIGRPTLFELVALRFTEEVERLLHEGLAKGYREVEANGSTFRGRLVGAAHVRANFARADRFFVRYPTFDRDQPINRILRAALDVLTHHGLSPPVHARVAAVAGAFPELSSGMMSPSDCDRIALTRSTLRYRNGLTLARMILEQRAPELRTGSTQVFALLFDMNALWECYVGWLFRRAAPENCEVALQESRGFWQVRPTPPRRVRPDLVLRDRVTGRTLLVADAKWKTLCGGVPADDDLKQMFVYNNLFGTKQSALVYPTVGAGRLELHGEYLDRQHRCGTAEIGLFEGGRLGTVAMIKQVRGLLSQLSSAGSTRASVEL